MTPKKKASKPVKAQKTTTKRKASGHRYPPTKPSVTRYGTGQGLLSGPNSFGDSYDGDGGGSGDGGGTGFGDGDGCVTGKATTTATAKAHTVNRLPGWCLMEAAKEVAADLVGYRHTMTRPQTFFVQENGDGDGYGYGDHYGDGYGNGNGANGNGRGDGKGNGNGNGRKGDVGDGRGDPYGDPLSWMVSYGSR